MQNVFSLLKANALKPQFVVARREKVEAIFGAREEMGHAHVWGRKTLVLCSSGFMWVVVSVI